MLRRLFTVVAIASFVSGVGAAVAAGADQSHGSLSPAPTVSTSTTVAQVGGQKLTQTISVSVRGGTLSVRPASVVVPLSWDRSHGRYTGHADIDVIDARGTLTGWTASALVQFANGQVSVRPGKPAVIDGYNSGLSAAKKTEVRSGDVATLGSAAAGDGGGSFRIPVDLELSGRHVAGTPTVTLVPQVGGA